MDPGAWRQFAAPGLHGRAHRLPAAQRVEEPLRKTDGARVADRALHADGRGQAAGGVPRVPGANIAAWPVRVFERHARPGGTGGMPGREASSGRCLRMRGSRLQR